MMEIIADLPEDVVGIVARGKITHEDYEHVIIPAMDDKFKSNDKLSVLFYMADFDGVEMAALWDDAKYGLSHWSDFERVALVTDEPGMKNVSAFFAWMIPAEIKVFSVAEFDAARSWISGLE